jgi:hypothetical protein
LNSDGVINEHILCGILLYFLELLFIAFAFDKEAPVRFVNDVERWHKEDHVYWFIINPDFPEYKFDIIIV